MYASYGKPLLLVLALVALCPFHGGTAASYEENRQNKYNERGYSWPIPENDFIPRTKGWRDLFEHRFRQIAEIQNSTQRYEAYAQAVSAAHVQPNFTQYGFGLARAPDDLMAELRQAIQDGLHDMEEEPRVSIIDGESPQPWFIDRPDLTNRVLHELKPYPERWTGIELEPVIAYGFRLYRNNSSLHMHVDRSNTHVISFILHIDSSDDAEPWPIAIEDLDGNTHEVVLTSGDMLFYESSKCFHGRPRKFKGSWYTSIFVHYYPKFFWPDEGVDPFEEKYYAIPPHWDDKPTTHYEHPLELVGTAFKEPRCENDWCSTENSIKWSGPGKDGYWIAPTGETYPLDPKPLPCEDWDTRCPEWASWKSNECRRNKQYMLSHCKKSCGACSTLETAQS